MNKEKLWGAILEVLEDKQDKSANQPVSLPILNGYNDTRVGTRRLSAEDLQGRIYNIYCGYSTVFDTACAIHAFAFEYNRTGQSRWKRRALQAFKSLSIENITSGYNEPIWGPETWWLKEGSISATGTVLDSLLKAKDYLGLKIKEYEVSNLFSYVYECETSEGFFTHDTIPDGLSFTPPPIINANAFAYKILCISNNKNDNFKNILGNIVDYQRPDGFWPYFFSSKLQLTLSRSSVFRKVAANKYVRKGLLPYRSAVYGDISHHCYILYLLLYSEAVRYDEVLESIKKGWKWLRHNIIEDTKKGYSYIDYGVEDDPKVPQRCNVRDSTSYFLILSIAPKLVKEGIIAEDASRKMCRKVVSYVNNNLIQKETDTKSIISRHDTNFNISRNIIPAVWSDISFKASLFASYLSNRSHKT